MTPFQLCAARLAENGYRVIRIDKGQKGPTYAGWQNTVTKVEDAARWPADGNIGVLAAHTPGVDIDVLDGNLAVEMEVFVSGLLGEAPTRIGRAPKRLMVYRAASPFRKVNSAVFVDSEGREHRVEVLGNGQQFVGYGVHPGTGKPYQWVGEVGDLRDVDTFELNTITVEQAKAIVVEFERRAALLGWEKKGTASGGGAEDDDLNFLRPKPDLVEGELEAAVGAFSNPGRDYDLWVKVGAALHHQTEGGADGLDLWHEWSAKSDLYDADAVDRKWASFGNYTGRNASVAFILAETKEARAKFKKIASTGEFDAMLARIEASNDVDELINVIPPEIRKIDLPLYRSELLISKVQARASKIAGVRIPVKAFREPKVASKKTEEPSPDSLAAALRLENDLAHYILDDQFNGGKHITRFSKMWWEYRGGVWKRAEDDMISSKVTKTLLRLTEMNDERLTSLFSRAAESRGDRLNALASTIVSLLEKIVAEEGGDDPLNLNAGRVPMVMNTLNCELWFKDDGSFEVRDHNPASKLTSQIGCVYDPDAESPTWDRALQTIFRGSLEPDEVIRHWEEIIGYALQPVRHVPVCMLMMGPGSNGKTFAMEIATAVAGSDAVSAMSLAEISRGANTHFADGLQGKLMLLDDDLKKNTLLPDDWLKKLSEAKQITANPKFARPYNFTARCIPIILANFAPSTTDLSEGLRRRMMVFESNYVIPEEAKNPRHKTTILDDELPGVLNRFIAALQRVLGRGFRFDPPGDCEHAKEKWLVSSNPTVLFTREVIERTKGGAVRAVVVYDHYLNWAKFNEHNIRGLGRNKFYEELERLGFRRANRNGIVYFTDIKLKAVEGLEFLVDN